MAEKAVKLLGAWSSPFVMRPMIAFNLKSVEYEFIDEPLYTQPKSEFLLKLNPVHKKIPALIHGDKPVCESLIIIEYIDETWSTGSPILPSDPYERATARFWASYIDEKWFPNLKVISVAQGDEAKKAVIDSVLEGLAVLEDAYVKSSNGKPFFGGDTMGHADITLGSFIGWIRVIEQANGIQLLDEAKIPNLVKWAEIFVAHPAVKDVMPETNKLAEFAKMFFAMMRAALPPS
jgi:glutathione S-transferase